MDERTKNELNEPFDRHFNSSTYREPIVLLGFICLSLISAINISHQLHSQVLYEYANDWEIILPFYKYLLEAQILGAITTALLSEFLGRKPIFYTLFALSIISSILSMFTHTIVFGINNSIQAAVSGGAFAITFLSIAEYSSPRHRFAYLVANAAVQSINVIEFEYMSIFAIAAGALGLIDILLSPESPYWLASKGRLVESKDAFLRLRGKQSESEFRGLQEEQRHPGPPRLYFLTLFIALVIVSISANSTLLSTQIASGLSYEYRKIHFNSGLLNLDIKLLFLIKFACTALIGSVVVLISYRVNRRLIFAVVSFVPLLCCFILLIVLYSDVKIDEPLFWIVFICSKCLDLGPAMIGMAIFVETIPLKYNTHMVGFCAAAYYFSLRYFIGKYLIRYYIIVAQCTWSLGGVILFYFMSKEPRDKTLLEIQKSYSYAPKQIATRIAPVPIAMEQLRNENSELVV